MARTVNLAWWFHRILLISGLFCMVAGIWWLFGAPPFGQMHLIGTPACWGLVFIGSDVLAMILNSSFYLGVFLVTQWAFLRPRRRWGVRLARKGRPMKSALAAAAVMGMLLSVGLVATLLELVDWWESILEHSLGIWGLWAAMAAIWALWVVVFLVYWRRGDRYTQLSRMVRGLIAGSVLELMVAIPVQATSSSSDKCYCQHGSYSGVVFGVTVLLWAFGPGIALMVLGEKARRDRAGNRDNGGTEAGANGNR